jgi:hypothetical protein
LRSIDPLEIDQHEVRSTTPVIHVGATDRTIHTPSEGLLKLQSLRSYPQRFLRQSEPDDVMLGDGSGLIVFDVVQGS